MSGRAASPVLALVLLLGLTAVVSVGILLVASAAVDDVESSAERTQAEASMTEFATAAAELRDGDRQRADVALGGAGDGRRRVNGSAGRVEVVVVENGTREPVLEGDLGAYRYLTDEDVEFGYQGGGVFRREDGHVEPVRPPAFDYRSAPTATLQVPTVRLRGNASDPGRVDDALAVADRRERSAGVDNPVTGDYAYVEIDSRYCTGWQQHVRQQTDGLLEEPCSIDGPATDVGELRVNMSLPDRYVNRTHDSGDGRTPGRTENRTVGGTYGIYAEGDVVFDGTGGTLNASIAAGGDVVFGADTGYDQRGTNAENVTHDREAHDARIRELLEATDPADARSLCPGGDAGLWSCELDAGTYRISDVDGGGGEVTFDVSDGDVVLVVPGDFETEDTTQWTVEGHAGGGSVRVFVAGDLTFGGATTMGRSTGPSARPGPVGVDDPVDDPPADPDADALQFYASSDSRVRITETFAFEGTISAPSPGAEHTSRAVAVESASVTLVGALHAGAVEIAGASTDVHQVPGAGTSGYVGNETPPEPGGDGRWNRSTSTREGDLSYLHVSETVLTVED